MDHAQRSAFVDGQQPDNNQADHPIEDAPPRKVSVTAKEFAAKYNNKREIYNFLACEVGVYLPPYDNTTIWFLKELMNGKKKMLRNTQIRTIHIPQ